MTCHRVRDGIRQSPILFPGNGWQWGEAAGLGKLAVCVNQQPWRKYCIQPPCGQLNPANPNLYSILRDVYRDVIDLTPPGEAFHMGGDEVSLAGAAASISNPDFRRFAQQLASKRVLLDLQVAFFAFYDQEILII